MPVFSPAINLATVRPLLGTEPDLALLQRCYGGLCRRGRVAGRSRRYQAPLRRSARRDLNKTNNAVLVVLTVPARWATPSSVRLVTCSNGCAACRHYVAGCWTLACFYVLHVFSYGLFYRTLQQYLVSSAIAIHLYATCIVAVVCCPAMRI